jgi:hypothetical protein
MTEARRRSRAHWKLIPAGTDLPTGPFQAAILGKTVARGSTFRSNGRLAVDVCYVAVFPF